jgi:hypothetical protein
LEFKLQFVGGKLKLELQQSSHRKLRGIPAQRYSAGPGLLRELPAFIPFRLLSGSFEP